MFDNTQITPELVKARTQLMSSGPVGAFLGSLAMSLVPIIRRDIPTAATDGKHLFYNPDYLASLTERQRVGLLVHEVGHPLSLHHTRRGERDMMEWNISCDLAINPQILRDKFELPEGLLFDQDMVGLSAEEIYRIREVKRQEEAEKNRQQEQDQQEQDQGDDSDQSEEGSDDAGDSDATEATNSDKSEEDVDSTEPTSANKDGPETDPTKSDSPNGSPSEEDLGDESSEPSSGGNSDDDTTDEGKTSEEPTGEAGEGDPEEGTPEAGQASGEAPQGQEKGLKGYSDPGMSGGIIDAAPSYDPAEVAEAEADWNQRVRQAVAVARKAGGGELPEELARLIGELQQPKLDARDILRRFIDSSVSKAYSWVRPNRRYLSHDIVLPSLVNDRPGHVVAVVDNSGSLWSKQAQSALVSELQGALDTGACDKVTIVYADTAVNGVVEYMPGDKIEVESHGGGGTDFRQPLAWVEENIEDAAVILYFTDLETCDWGDEPSVPLLWVAYGNPRYVKNIEVPFGEVIYLDQ